MKKIKLFLSRLLLAMLTIAATQHTHAQTTATEWYNQGVSATDNNEQLRCYTKAIELAYTPLAYAYYNRGNTKYYLGRYAEAITDYDKAIELDPNYKDTYNNRGIVKRI